MKFCVDRCNFQKWKNGKFSCGFYEKDLQYIKVEKDTVKIIRCLKCDREETIHERKVNEKVNEN